MTAWAEPGFATPDLSQKSSGSRVSLGEDIPAAAASNSKMVLSTDIYQAFMAANALPDLIPYYLDHFREGNLTLQKASQSIQKLFITGSFPEAIQDEIERDYNRLSGEYGENVVPVSLKSGVVYEGAPNMSPLVYQQEFLRNIYGLDALLNAIRHCYAAVYSEQAMTFREQYGLDARDFAVSVAIYPVDVIY